MLDQYAEFGAFAFRTKAEASNENRSLQRERHSAEQCETRDMHFTPSTVHPAENDARLPEIIRGGHYIHFRHFCAVLGCEHAPYCKIQEQFDNIGSLINPFPILHKDDYTQIEEIISRDSLLSERDYSTTNVSVISLLEAYNRNKTELLYGTSPSNGYPIAEILQAVAYVIANDDELSGKRPKGYIQIIQRHTQADNQLSVEIRTPELLTPLVIVGNGRGALIGARNPEVYSRLVTCSPENEYKILVRPISVEDLRDAN